MSVLVMPCECLILFGVPEIILEFFCSFLPRNISAYIFKDYIVIFQKVENERKGKSKEKYEIQMNPLARN